MRQARAFFFVCLGILCIVAAVARADVTSVTAIPPSPVFGDSLKVEADGLFYDTCTKLTGQTCTVDGDTLRFTVSAFYKPVFCFTVLWYYHQVCNFGVLSPGTYQVLFREVWTLQDQPEPVITVRTFPVTVSSPTPVRAATWGRIKSLYR